MTTLTTLSDCELGYHEVCQDPACTSAEHLPDPDGDTIWTFDDDAAWLWDDDVQRRRADR